MFSIEEETLSKFDIFSVVNSEIYDPFIWMFGILAIACFIWVWFEPKRK